MRLSELSTKTQKQASDSDVSRNAQFLTRAGYIGRLMAGVYSFLPLGMRVLNNIENIIRDEMNGIGGQEILMPALQPKDIWEKTGRWDKVDILFKLKGTGNRDLALGPTHEEVVTPLMAGFIQSYRDLPKAVYQIQTKFRNEARAKSGLLRGREFRMKDLYSFHTGQDDLDVFYEDATAAYHRIFKRCGLGDITLLTYASGGIFSKYSHEFQTVTPYGEDVIYRVPGTNIAINKEIIGERELLAELIPDYKPGDEKNLEEVKAIEVGNIFKLGTRFAESFSAGFTDADGTQKFPVMGCYGIGPSRVMGAIAECLSDDNGLIWPEQVAPYRIHLVSLVNDAADIEKCEKIYQQLCAAGMSVLYDDRDARAGEKLADADLIGLPHRVILGKKTLATDSFEWKKRTEADSTILPLEKICDFIPAGGML